MNPFTEIRDRLRASRDRVDRVAEVDAIAYSFRESCIGAGLGQMIDGVVAGTAYRTPVLAHVQLGPPLVLTARMLPGQVPADLARVGRLLAPHLGGLALRVDDRGFEWAVVRVLTSDPLAGTLPLDVEGQGVLIGRDEDGDDIRVGHPVELPHLIAQGQTRSGKSSWLYGLIAQCVRAEHVEVAGVDPSGITLRPLAGERIVLGLSDVERIEAVLSGLVADMDARLAAMPADRDILPTGPGTPVVLVVLDEWPATLRGLDAVKTTKDDPGKRVRALVARLLAESHKCGYRVVIAAQRAEATIVGGAERAQCGGRLSFRVDSWESVKLLHPGDDAAALAGDHAAAPAGIALLSWPGRPLTRIRAPYLGGYREFVAAVTEGTHDPGALPGDGAADDVDTADTTGRAA